jgi:ParB family transcriptional regulator, chromosome partitioning protein
MATSDTRSTRKARLGRGLSALMAKSQPVAVAPPASDQATQPANASPPSERPTAAPADPTATPSPPADASAIQYIAVTDIQPNPHQPRQSFDPAALDRLADSIRRDGLMQPVILRRRPQAASGEWQVASGGSGEPPSDTRHPTPGNRQSTPATRHSTLDTPRYELVAGERRWRAAQHAGLDRIPAIVRDLDDAQLAEWALVENLQREDLNPIERAVAFRHLIDRFSLSHEQIAQRVGVERSTITNALRLLTLPEDVQQLIRMGQLSAGHARAIAGLSDAAQQSALARRTVRYDLSVRQVEANVRAISGGTSGDTSGGGGGASSPGSRNAAAGHVADLEDQLTKALGAKVKLRLGRKKGTGTLSIHFHSLEAFDALLERLKIKLD